MGTSFFKLAVVKIVNLKTKKSNMRRIFLGLLTVPFSIMAQSPGGVRPNMYLWLKADSSVNVTGSNVSSWVNLAPSVTMTTQASKTASTNVVLSSNAFNYNPTLVFDGASNQRLAGQYGTAPGNAPLIFIAVKKINNAGGCCKNPFSQGGAGNAGISFNNGSTEIYGLDGNGSICSPSVSAVGRPAVIRADYNAVNNQLGGVLAFNGTAGVTCGSSALNAADNTFQVGGRTYGGQSGRIFGGQIAEVILYNSNTVTSTQVNQIESYLAIKYGISLSTDYRNSAGSTIFSASSHNNHVIGLMRDDSSALLQKQSRHDNDSIRIYLSSLASSNRNNSGRISSNLQSLLIGHNGDSLLSKGSAEFPGSSGIFSRIQREWKITNTNFDSTFSLDIRLKTTPLNPSHLRILIDDDADFSNATMYNPSISETGSMVTISGISTTMIPTNSTRFMTIVSTSVGTPLPIGPLSFDARATTDGNVELTWQTLEETHDLYFDIERSTDQIQWPVISQLKGSGYSNTLSNYMATDIKPTPGIYFYRLKATYSSSTAYYSPIRQVILNGRKNLLVYPNPADDYFMLEGNEEELSEITIFNWVGQDVTDHSSMVAKSKEEIKISIENLPCGLYYIRTKTKTVILDKA
jgi:hypothetical protein